MVCCASSLGQMAGLGHSILYSSARLYSLDAVSATLDAVPRSAFHESAIAIESVGGVDCIAAGRDARRGTAFSGGAMLGPSHSSTVAID